MTHPRAQLAQSGSLVAGGLVDPAIGIGVSPHEGVEARLRELEPVPEARWHGSDLPRRVAVIHVLEPERQDPCSSIGGAQLRMGEGATLVDHADEDL